MHDFRGPMFRVLVLLHVWSTHASKEIREKKMCWYVMVFGVEDEDQ